MYRPILCLMVVGLLTGANAVKDGKGDLERVQGTWQPSTVEANGMKLDQDELKELRVVIEKNTYTVYRGQEKIDSGTLTLKEDHNPKQLDDTSTFGDTQGKSMKGIYELKGDTWKLCLALPGKPRPKDYTAGEGTDHVLYVMKHMGK